GVAASPELFDALEADLDLIAYMLEKLLAGESNVALPRLAPKSATGAETAGSFPEPKRVPPKAPVIDQPIVAAVAASAPALRVPPLEADLLELANSVSRLRGELREIEIQTDAQMRSRMTELWQRHGEC